MKKFALVTPLILSLSQPAFADDNQAIDPADVTKVYTQTALLFSGNSQFQWQGQVAGGLENGQQFAFLTEATFDNKDNHTDKFGFDYQNSRTQYFHVFNTDAAAFPKIGASLDYVNTRTDSISNDLLSIGGVAAINPAYTKGLMVFPRAGYMTGSMEVKGLTSEKDSLSGYALGLITAKHLGDSGAYVSVVPEWQSLQGDEIEMSSMSVKTSLNAPLNSSRTWWINTRFDLTKSDITVSGSGPEGEWQSEAWIGVRHYF